MMLFLDFVPGQTDMNVSAAHLPDHLKNYAKFLLPVLEKCAAPTGRCYQDVSSLRHDLNTLYRLV